MIIFGITTRRSENRLSFPFGGGRPAILAASMLGLRRSSLCERNQCRRGESPCGCRVLDESDNSHSAAMIVGFPTRAVRDSDLTPEDYRLLIGVGLLADTSGWCAEDIGMIAENTAISESAVRLRLDQLCVRGLVRRKGRGRAAMLGLVPDTQAAPIVEHSQSRADARSSPTRRGGRSTQARLHSDMLRPRARRPIGSIDLEDPPQPHPVVASLQDSMQSEPGGINGFRFWIQTILDPNDVEIFSDWASRQSTQYRDLMRKFDNARDDQAIESLLEDTLAFLNREKGAER